MRLRLFIALPFSENVMDCLYQVQTGLKRNRVGGSFTTRHNLHLTIAFFGETEEAVARHIVQIMKENPMPAIELKFTKLSKLRDMIIAEIESSKELSDYVSRLRWQFDLAGIEYDRKKFMPHITLVRRADIPSEDFKLSRFYAPLSDLVIEQSEVALMCTEFIEGAPKYTPVFRQGNIDD